MYVSHLLSVMLPYPRSLEELAVYIGKLEARWKTEPVCTSDNELPEEVSIQSNSVLENCKKGFSESEENCDSPHVRSGEERNDRLPSKAGRRLASKKARSSGLKRAGKKEAAVMEEEVGCLKCHKDTNYKQVCSWGRGEGGGCKWVEEWGIFGLVEEWERGEYGHKWVEEWGIFGLVEEWGRRGGW